MTEHHPKRRPIVEPATNTIITSAIKVHQRFGPGLLESAYRTCLAHDVRKSGLSVVIEPYVDISFDDLIIQKAYRLDLVVAGSVVVEVKHVEKVLAVHEAQLRTYLRLTGIRSGLLLNFNVTVMRTESGESILLDELIRLLPRLQLFLVFPVKVFPSLTA